MTTTRSSHRQLNEEFLVPSMLRMFDAGAEADNVRAKVVVLYDLLIAANVAAWLWALLAFRHYPVLLGTAFLAYGFGLRHAVDADHIAAIDNVTRKLMHEGKRPVTIGLFFSLGHSTIVVLASVVSQQPLEVMIYSSIPH